MVDSIEITKYTRELNILFAEDHNELRIDTTEILKSFFKNVDSCSNGQEAVEKFPTAKSQDVLGWIYYNHKKYTDALAGFENAVHLAPYNPFYHYHLGLAHQKMEKKLRAAESFNRALSLIDLETSREFAKKLNYQINQCK